MEQKKNSKSKMLWLLVLLLFIGVAATTVTFTHILNGFLPDDQGAISLQPEDSSSGKGELDGQAMEKPSAKPHATTPKPNFEASDDQGTWKTNTQVEIFKISYQNGEKGVTIQSDNKDAIIAPGAKNSYTFKFKNTGNAALDYTLEMDATVSPANYSIPLTAKINRYDGTWILGDREQFASIPELDAAEDRATLGAGRYTYYTLDWVWPFEGEDDALDTLLGNAAADQEITFTLWLKTTATQSSDPNADGGISLPNTGDHTNITFWFVIMVGSLIIMIILFLLDKKDRRDEKAEA